MKKFKTSKKVLALLLSLSLIFTMMPATAWSAFAAEEEPIDAAIVFADLHTNKNDYKDESGEAIPTIFGALKASGLPFSSVTSGGDAFSVNEDSSSSNGPYNGYTETISTAIRTALDNDAIPVNYVWSDHDRYAYQENDTATTSDDTTLLEKKSHVSYGAGADGIIGNADDGKYYVYSLSMGDICSYDRYNAGFSSNRTANGFTESVEKAIENFEEDVAEMDKTKPLLIVSHQPLYDNRNDNAFAEQWFDSINEVAKGMDVAFFYGHNHKYDKASDYYYAKGSQMPVATKNGWENYEVGQGYKPSCDLQPTSKTLNFTHMCAGYMDPHSTGSYDSNTTRQNTAVAVTIYEDSIQFKSYGAGTYYNANKYPLDETVIRAHAATSETPDNGDNPGTGETPEVFEGDWVTITEPTGGTTTYSYTQATSITPGEKYVIVGNNNAVALMDNDGTMGSQSITISEDSMTSTTKLTEWTFSSSTKGTVKSDKNNNLYYSNSAFGLSNSNATTLTFADNGNNFRIWNDRAYQTDYSFYYDGSKWTRNKDSDKYVRLYIRNEDGDVTVGGTDGLYGKISGNLSYDIPFGTSPEDAVAFVKAGIDISYHTGDASTAQPYGDDDAGMTWTLDPNYNGNVPGEYEVTIAYNGVTLGVAKVVVPTKAIKSVAISGNEGSVERGGNSITGAVLNVTYDDETTAEIPLTVDMISAGEYNINENGTYNGLTIEYNGTKVTDVFTLNVVNVAGNDFPDYPNPGSVELTKTATPLDQNTGLTRVDLSTSGLPVNKGVDVIVMLDTSSSMDRCVSCGQYTSIYSDKTSACRCTDKVTRLDELKLALEDLESALKSSPNASDIRVAVTDFNGMYSTGPCAYDTADRTKDVGGLTNAANTQVFTKPNSDLDINAFISASDLDVSEFNLTGTVTHTGTNYDYAYDAIYRLGYAIRQDNIAKNQENRELYVLFMSDGAPNQYNYYFTTGGTASNTDWRYWLNGDVENNEGMSGTVQCQTHTYYYDEATNNAHRMATAIKGDPNTLYNVIRKDISDLGSDVFKTPTGEDEYAGKANMYKVNGLGAKLYSIAFYVGADGGTTADDAKAALRKNASEDKYIDASNGDDLAKAFHDIGVEIAYAATNAVFTDIMGDDFKLQLGTTVKSNATDATNGKETVDTDIIVKTENVYIPSQVGTTVLGHLVTNADVGKPYGDPTELEKVEFNEDGTVATSSQLEGNILKDGVICAKTFVYNTNPLEKEVELADGNKIKLGPDEFYWTIGTINQKRYTLSYMAYLTGSMEGTRETGSFKTNNLAELTYVNWLGNTVSQTVTSPVVAWGKAQVKYAFYLVNEQGQPVYANGEIAPNFERAYKVTNPVVYNSIKLNGTETILSTEGADVLPSEYTLYDDTAAYAVRPLSGDGYGEECGWTITAGPGKTLTADTSTTYVTGYNGNDYTNAMDVHEGSYAYTDTTVYFAVTWSTKALPDTVVIDYGLPVDISVLQNDMFAQKTLEAVGPVVEKADDSVYDTTLAEGFGSSKTCTYGKAEANVTKDKVRYTPTTMEMNGYDKFAYSVKSTGAGTTDQVYYYGTVTVIPATTIYYEEDFITYNDITWQQKEGGPAWEGEWAVKEVTNPEDSVWRTEGEKKANAVQGEDRPGQYSLADANHIYGYDAVNKSMSTYSLGSAKVATVSGNDGAQAQFTFYGTGFDIISMTNNTTGAILVDVEKKVGNEWTTFDNYVVDTYYGYKQVAGDADKDGTIEEGEVIWEVDPKAEDSLYQVPVIKMVNKEYGQYRVTIKATYEQFFDHVDGSSAYDFYLDAIRIYDPANDGASDGTTDTTIEDAYKADGEGWPSYIELRNKLIDTEKQFGGIWGNDDTTTEEDERTVVEGLVFIDGDDSVGNDQLTDYKNYGPNNEVYLKPGQRVAFMVNAPNNLANIHIGIKSADGIPATYTITNIAREDSADGKVKAGDYYNPKTATIDTATDMYYDMTPWKGNIVVISNTGDRYGTKGAISLTNIKSTYTSDPNGQETTGDVKAGTVEPKETSIYMTPAAAALTLRSLNTPVVPDEPETPVDPETPVEPEEPETPDTPVTPEEPDAPVTPEDPDTPVVPETPVEPEEPETPPVVDEPEEPVAAPAKIISLKTDKQNYVQGDKVKVIVTTNKETTKVKVGTKVLKNFKTKNGNRTWTTTVKANKIGKLTIGAIAYNSKGTATKKVTKKVTVKRFAPKTFNVKLSKSKVKVGAKYTVTVKAGTAVKYVKVNGKKITKYTYNKKAKTRTFKITYKAAKAGKKTVKVVAYNKAGYASKAKTKTVTVKKK